MLKDMPKGIVATLGVALLLGGCATSSVDRVTGVTTTQALPVHCSQQLQEGCVELRAMNYRMDTSNALLSRLVRSQNDDSERGWRVQFAPLEAEKAYQAGHIKPAGPRTFRVFVFGGRRSPNASPQAYRLNGKASTKTTFRDVTGRVPYPMTTYGAPTRVYEVDAVGPDPGGATVQLPWAMLSGAAILICATDNDGLYPSGQVVNGAHDGHWVTPEYLEAARNRGWKYMIMAFISNR